MNTDIKREYDRFKEKLKEDLIARIKGIDDTIELIKLHKSISGAHAEGSSSSTINIHENDEKAEKFKGYAKPSSYKHKLVSVLKIENKFLSVNEISGIIHMLEPELAFEEIKRGVGSAKSNLLKDGAIVKYVVGSSNLNSFYGSGSWLDENGNPKPEHMYNEESLVVKEEVKI